MPVIDIEAMLETVFHVSTLVVPFGTVMVAYRLTKFFREVFYEGLENAVSCAILYGVSRGL